MSQNLSEALRRGEQLKLFEQKAEDISNNTEIFKMEAKDLRKKMCWDRYRWWILGILIGFVLLDIIIIIIAVKVRK
jgi:vesicle-associated membrane protein 7